MQYSGQNNKTPTVEYIIKIIFLGAPGGRDIELPGFAD